MKVETSPRTIITGLESKKRYPATVLYSTSTPTATVQPTLVSLPGAVKPLIGTVSPQNFSNSTFQTFPGMGSVGGYGTSQGYQYPGYPVQYGHQYQYQAKSDQYGGGAGAGGAGGGGGYFIGGGAPVPPYHGAALVPVTTSSTSFPPASAAIYGPYSYGPYPPGRVIGPILIGELRGTISI